VDLAWTSGGSEWLECDVVMSILDLEGGANIKNNMYNNADTQTVRVCMKHAAEGMIVLSCLDPLHELRFRDATGKLKKE